MKKLEDKFKEWCNDGEHATWDDRYGYIEALDKVMVLEFIKEIREQDIKAFESMIGEDEDKTPEAYYEDKAYFDDTCLCGHKTRNTHRAELRTKLDQYKKTGPDLEAK